jgi:hypothetical protein
VPLLTKETIVDNEIMIDMSLFTSLIMFPEALLEANNIAEVKRTKEQKLLLMSLFSYAHDHQSMGWQRLVDLAETGTFPKKEIYRLIDGVLGNPVWGLFYDHRDDETSIKFLEDLDGYVRSVPPSIKKSLKSLMCGYTDTTTRKRVKGFLDLHPQYGGVEAEAEALGLSVDDVRQRRRQDCRLFHVHRRVRKSYSSANRLGDIVVRLSLIQAAAIPRSKKEQVAYEKSLNSNTKANTVLDTGECIRRPDTYLYTLAFKGLVGLCSVDREVFDEMMAMHRQRGYTNFLPFAPLFLQWFALPTQKSHLPSVNQLASILGEYSGSTSHFMGEYTKLMNQGSRVEWESLGLTLGKLCIKKDPIPDVTLDASEDDVLRDYLTKTYTDPTNGQVWYGTDLGWHLVATSLQDCTNVQLTQIRNSLRTHRILYHNFAKKGKSRIFRTPASRKRLDRWRRDLSKQQIIMDILGSQMVVDSFTRLPSFEQAKDNPYTVLPYLTRALYLEQADPIAYDAGIFICGSCKEAQEDKTTIVEERKSERETLKQEQAIRDRKFDLVSRDLLITKIVNLNQSIAIAKGSLKSQYEQEMDEFLVELVYRDLGICFRYNRTFNFKHFLNEKHIFGCEYWPEAVTVNWDVDTKKRPTQAVQDVSDVWACMSLIKAAQYIKQEGTKFSFSEAYEYHAVKRFPLPSNQVAKQRVLSLLPLIYCRYFLQILPNPRSKLTHMLVPRIKISKYKDTNPVRITNDVNCSRNRIKLKSLLKDHKLITTFQSIEEFNPSDILRELCTHMRVPFNPNNIEAVFKFDPLVEEPEAFLRITKLKEALALYIEEYCTQLSRSTFIELASFTSIYMKHTKDKVIQIYNQYKATLHQWFSKITEPLRKLEYIEGLGVIMECEDDDLESVCV